MVRMEAPNFMKRRPDEQARAGAGVVRLGTERQLSGARRVQRRHRFFVEWVDDTEDGRWVSAGV